MIRHYCNYKNNFSNPVKVILKAALKAISDMNIFFEKFKDYYKKNLNVKVFLLRLGVVLTAAFFLVACGAQARETLNSSEYSASEKNYASIWQPLANRLSKDGITGSQVDELLAQLGDTPTQSPMGRKIKELYNRKFFPKPKSNTTSIYYKGVVTQAHAQECRDYIKTHQAVFDAAYDKYGVPPAIAAALLFVETRLGRVLGDIPENAFFTLASMAISTKPQDIDDWLPQLNGYQKHLDWIKETMQKRAQWAYNETAALIRHMLQDHIAPDQLPGSIYGAVGLCQFMPSNISIYGADGDNDGRVDLFNPPDAIFSLSRYLAKHGWKTNLTKESQHKILMTYNHSTVYANTIMALAALINGETYEKTVKPVKKRTKAK